MELITRRGFLAAGAAAVAYAHLSPSAFARAQAPLQLTVARRTLEVAGRAASVLGLVRPNGRAGLVLDPGERFAVDLINDLDVDTIIHWHGQISTEYAGWRARRAHGGSKARRGP